MNNYVFNRQRLKEVAKININVRASILVVFLVFVLPSWFGSLTTTKSVWIDGFMYEQEITSPISTLFTTAVPLVLGYWATSYFMIAYIHAGEEVNSLDVLKKLDLNKFVMYIAKIVVADVFTVLWAFLFLVPGIVKHYSYAMVPYIAVDEPDLGILETITKSRTMMDGYKADTFVLDLSFIGWNIVNVFTFGLLNFWLAPYKQLTYANLFFDLLSQQSSYTGQNNSFYSTDY